MKIAILSDIHSNMSALKQAEEIIEQEMVDSVYICGDVVGYGKDVNECCERVREKRYVVVAGNHDYAVSHDDFDLSDYSAKAYSGIILNRKKINEENRNWLRELPLYYQTGDIEMVHGSLIYPETFQYFELIDAEDNFKVMKGRVCFVGHTHSPGIYVELGGKRKRYKKIIPAFKEYNFFKGRLIVDVGSVGLPRNFRKNGSLVIYTLEDGKIEFKRFIIK